MLYAQKDSPQGFWRALYSNTPPSPFLNWRGRSWLQLDWISIVALRGTKEEIRSKRQWPATSVGRGMMQVAPAKAVMMTKGSEPLESFANTAGTSRVFPSLHCSPSHRPKPAPSHIPAGTSKWHGWGWFLWLVPSRLPFIWSYQKWDMTYALDVCRPKTVYQRTLSRHTQ